MSDKTSHDSEILTLTTDIVISHVSNNAVAVDDLPGLIARVYDTLANIGGAPARSVPGKAKPAVSVKKSVTPEYIICLEDGKKFKMLKRHLRTSYNLTPDEYRARWGLPSDYPMVAPKYAAARRRLAKKIGLGRGRRKKRGKR